MTQNSKDNNMLNLTISTSNSKNSVVLTKEIHNQMMKNNNYTQLSALDLPHVLFDAVPFERAWSHNEWHQDQALDEAQEGHDFDIVLQSKLVTSHKLWSWIQIKLVDRGLFSV